MNVTEQNRLVAAGLPTNKAFDMTPCDHGLTVSTCVICNGHAARDKAIRAENSRQAFLRFKFAMKHLRDKDDLLIRVLPTTAVPTDQRLYVR